MRTNIMQLREKRINASKVLQSEYDKLTSYQDKFKFIFNLLEQNLYEFSKWNKTDFVFKNKDEIFKLA